MRKKLARVIDAIRHPMPHRVVTRVLLAFALVATAFVGVAGWGVIALRSSANQSRLMRLGYLPLTRTLRDLVTMQDTWNAQLNHITTARNPADARVWFDAVLHIGRPKKFAEVRAAISVAFVRAREPSVRQIGRDLLAEVRWVERSLEAEPELLRRLFDAMNEGDSRRAERYRDGLLKRGLSSHRRLSNLDQRVLTSLESLSIDTTEQELFAVRLLVMLSVLTGLIGVTMVFYVRRVLRPLETVTRRARDVAGGDLSPRSIVSTGDEIGELALAFENMVGAIATMREQMLSADRLATIGKMAAHVTHEIRNPLSALALNAELLEDELPQDADEARSLLAAVQRELARLTELTEQYLSIARHRPAKVEPEDLVCVVREAVAFLERDLSRRKLWVEQCLPNCPVYLPLDEMQIRQAIFNLIRNADEAMPEGGRIRVSLLELAPDEVFESGAASQAVQVPARRVILMVDDDGCGIDAALAAKIFDPFVTTKMTGTGLGLAVTRQIVESNGGRIYCASAPSGGARFVIEFSGVSDEPPVSRLGTT